MFHLRKTSKDKEVKCKNSTHWWPSWLNCVIIGGKCSWLLHCNHSFVCVKEARMENRQYESVKALVRQLHAPNKNVSRPHSDGETSEDEKDRKFSLYSLPVLTFEKQNRKKSLFESNFKIPVLTVTGPNSPESPENNPHRRFSFGLYRRHSHAVRLK